LRFFFWIKKDFVLFEWLAKRRRKKLMAAPFPEAWEDIVRRNVGHYCMLNGVERAHLRALIQVFIAEKHWVGAGGLFMTDEIRVTISAQACLLLLGLPHNYYQNVQTIVVYQSTVVPPPRRFGFFEVPLAPVEPNHPIIGQVFSRDRSSSSGMRRSAAAVIPNQVIMSFITNSPTNWICWMAELTEHLRSGAGRNIATGFEHARGNIFA